MKKTLFCITLGVLLFFGFNSLHQNIQAYTSSNYDVNITTLVYGAEESLTKLENQPYGSLITPINSTTAPEGNEFAFWVVNGIVRKDLLSNHQFTVTANLELVAAFEPEDNSYHVIVFVDSNGKLIETSFVEDGSDIEDLPSTENFSKPKYVVAEVAWKETNGNEAILSDITESKVFVLQYELEEGVEPVVVTVNGQSQSYAYNEIVTVTTDVEDFTHWEEDGVVVSYNRNYSFTVLADRDLVAKNDGSPQPLVILNDVSGIRSDHKSFLGQVYLPAGFEIIELGLLASNEEKLLLIDDEDVIVIPSNTLQSITKEFLRSFSEDTFTTIRAYAVLKNGENQLVLYSERNYVSEPELNYPGDGTAESPFVITTPEELASIGTGDYTMTAHYILANNIDLSSICGPEKGSFTPIGNNDAPFRGSFDGNGKTISNLYINQEAVSELGLFGNAISLTIKDLTIVNANVTGNQHVGIVVGNVRTLYANNIKILNGVVHSNNSEGIVGGFAGQIAPKSLTGNVDNIYLDVIVTGLKTIGGFAGRIAADNAAVFTMSNIEMHGEVKGFSRFGGLIGRLYRDGSSTNEDAIVRLTNIVSYVFLDFNDGTKDTHFGGFIGEARDLANTEITNIIIYGSLSESVKAKSRNGTIIGFNNLTFNAETIYAVDPSNLGDGSVAGNELLAENITNISWYESIFEFDLDNVWKMGENGLVLR